MPAIPNRRKSQPRPKFSRVSETMKEWSAMLAAELLSWPAVTSRRMFGMTVFYRANRIFAALPRTKTFSTPQSIAFKLHRKTARIQKMLAAEPKIVDPTREDAKWISLQLNNEQDLAVALKWFDLAYRTCLLPNNSKT